VSPQAIIDRSPEMIRRLTDPALRAMVLAMAAALTLRCCESETSRRNSPSGLGCFTRRWCCPCWDGCCRRCRYVFPPEAP